MKEFPVPVKTIGPSTQVEEENLNYMPMPQGMETFRAPILPEPEDVVDKVQAKQSLHQALSLLSDTVRDGQNRSVNLEGMSLDDLKLINTVLGEGEVSALVTTQGDQVSELKVQESVFAGVWRVVHTVNNKVVSDIIELGYIPQALKNTATQDRWDSVPRWQGELPPNVQNAPLILTELEEQWQNWKPGQSTYVVNLTLLPMSVEDIAFMDHHLGTGRVVILSRGYGNCRITNTCMPNTWRVVYYNSQDVVILNTVEITELPDVAQAAKEDLEDSFDRLTEVLEWVEGK